MTAQIDAIYRSESRRVLATLIRVLGDFDLAEEAMHDAFRQALEQDSARRLAIQSRAADLREYLRRHGR